MSGRKRAAAIIVRDGRVLMVHERSLRDGSREWWTLPGGGIETGESVTDAVRREVLEETGISIEPVALAGYREVITRDDANRVQGHFVILAFAARWVAGEPRLNEEISEARWIRPAGLRDLTTTEGLAEIVAAAFELIERGS